MSTSHKKLWGLSIVLLIIVSTALPVRGAYIPRVLILNSYHSGYDWSDQIMDGIKAALTGEELVLIEFMDTKRIETQEYMDGLARLYTMKYADQHFDLIFATDDRAYQFILEYHEQIFPDTPVVFVGVDDFDPAQVAGLDWITGIVQLVDFQGQIEVIQQLLPDTRSVYLITDSTYLGYAYRLQMQELSDAAVLPVGIHIIGDMEDGIRWDALLEEIGALPDNSVIIYGSYTRDAAGTMINVDEATAAVVEAANVPVFVTNTINLHDGAIGGEILDGYTEGSIAGQMGESILQGIDVSEVPIKQEINSILCFDYLALERWDIPTSRLPEGSTVINEPAVDMLISRTTLIVGVVLVILETGLVFLLFWLNRRRKVAENALLKQQEQLEQTVEERTEELQTALNVKNQFLANMSHELRTPLTAIMGFSELLMLQTADILSGKQRNALTNIFKSGEHLHSLINDVLTMTKINSNQVDLALEHVNLKQLIKDAVIMANSKACKKDIKIKTELDPFIKTIHVDERRMRQVIIILLDNAIKFSPEGSTIKVRTKLEVAEPSKVTISVIDKGIGIPENDQERIFEPFVQLDNKLSREYDGSGLGLAVCKQLVDLHSGSISVESTVNQGTSMIVNLPARTTRVTAEISSSEISALAGDFPSLKGRHFNILIAEHNETTLDLLSCIFNSTGISFTVAHEGLDVIHLIRQTDPDLVLLDLHLPKQEGYDVIRNIRAMENGSRLPILVISAIAFDDEVNTVLQAGADAFLKKPFLLQELFDQLITLLNGTDREVSSS